MKRLLRFALICACAFAFASLHGAPSVVARPKLSRADQRKAKRLVRQMGRLFAQKRYREVIVIARQLHGLLEDPQLLANIGLCYERLGDDAQALAHYQQFLRTAPRGHKTRSNVENQVAKLKQKLRAKKREVNILSQPTGARVSVDSRFVGLTPTVVYLDPGRHVIELAMKGRETLRREILIVNGPALTLDYPLPKSEETGWLTVTSNVPSAEIFLDNELIGKTPLRRKALKRGRYQVKVNAPGYRELQERVTIESGRSTVLRANLVKVDAPHVVTPSRPRGDRSELGRRLWLAGWITFGVSIAALASGTALYFVGRKNAVDLNRELSRYGTDHPEATQEEAEAVLNFKSRWDRRVKRNLYAGYALWGITGVGLVASIVMLSLAPQYRRKRAERLSRRFEWQLTPTFAPRESR
ncbi:MAG: PEGA domain-containing protein, partial [Myxococcales bacterium]|nr:PEGA domain-containing protein [Myxococcales bacterium]